MKNDLTCTASSCAVENLDGGKIRLTMTFMHFGEYNDAKQSFLSNPGIFEMDKRRPEHGGCSGGSRLVVEMGRDFDAAMKVLGGFKIRRDNVQFINGSIQPCANIGEAVQRALDYNG